MVLNAVYEPEFAGFSYGARPGRSAHQALAALDQAIGQEAGEMGFGRRSAGLFRVA